MKKVYAIADNIFSPLGLNSKSNWSSLLNNNTGVDKVNKPSIHLKNFFASVFKENFVGAQFQHVGSPDEYTRLEQMYILSILDAVEQSQINAGSKKTLFIISSTKGNIDLLEDRKMSSNAGLYLPVMANKIAQFFKNPNESIVVSNACISGVVAIQIAANYIRQGVYDHVIVSGGDIISEFTVSGFHSLLALSQGNCKPFDQNRDGINLGEAAATIILSSDKISSLDIEIVAGATSNDANHISGPSKTGDGMAMAIDLALKKSKLSSTDIGFISAHGTATPYNDEMETKAFHLSNLGNTHVNSLKGYFGHTLGAAGILETIVSLWSLKEQLIIASLGYKEHGVTLPLNVVKNNQRKEFAYCLKTASGFGGCNAALILSNNG